MSDYDYLIVGGGMTADAAVQGIRERDPAGTIALFSNEPHPPYSRPPLSKKLWAGKPEDSIWRRTPQAGVTLHLGTPITAIDPHNKFVTDIHNQQHSYGKLLLATGVTPRRLTHTAEGVLYFRTLDDYRRLHQLALTGTSFVIVGGGFIGSEIAAALNSIGKRVTMIFPDKGLGAHLYPPGMVDFLTRYYTMKGVELLAGERTTSVQLNDGSYSITTESGIRREADGVVAGIGAIPEVALAEGCGIAIDNGIVVDEQLRTSLADIYAAGDVANFYNPALDKRMRVEHEDNALTMGKMAGRNMAGAAELYHHLPYFYSDLFDLGYEAVGELNARMEIVEDWQELYRKGVVYYLSDGRIRGILLWNVWDKVDAARALIESRRSYARAELIGKISS